LPRILLIDDDASLREVLTFTLTHAGHEVEAAPDGERGVAELSRFGPDVVITDLKMPGMNGLEVLRRVHAYDPAVPVILLTAFGSIEEAVEAMKLGAHHYLTKPCHRDELTLAVSKALERRNLVLENRRLRDRLRAETKTVDLVHASAAMQAILEMVRRIAPTDATVLLTGESGTGKEVIAQTLHAGSERWEKPFVPINCAAIPRDLMESELFGYAKGAFTGAVKDKPGKFQRADGGTLFLDEVADLPQELQTKLLRALETRQVDVVGGQHPVQVDVRVIAATNADLVARVHEGHFRRDLYYRLNVIPIHIPPLRDRSDDIPALWEHFVRAYAAGATVRSTPGLVRALMQRAWPGNVRELANVCQRMVLLRTSDELTLEALPPHEAPEASRRSGFLAERGEDATPGPGAPDAFLGPLPEGGLSLPDVERALIVRALAKCEGNRTRTAKYLGIPRHVLLYRLEKFGITP
jgi:two-component system NtrC family response regulator